MGGGYRNDPNASIIEILSHPLVLIILQWGNAMVIVPLQLYQCYGDIRILQIKYPIMVDYMNYLINRAAGNPYLNDGGLGDWEGLGTLSHTDLSLAPLIRSRHNDSQGLHVHLWISAMCSSHGRD